MWMETCGNRYAVGVCHSGISLIAFNDNGACRVVFVNIALQEQKH